MLDPVLSSRTTFLLRPSTLKSTRALELYSVYYIDYCSYILDISDWYENFINGFACYPHLRYFRFGVEYFLTAVPDLSLHSLTLDPYRSSAALSVLSPLFLLCWPLWLQPSRYCDILLCLAFATPSSLQLHAPPCAWLET